MTSKIRWNYPLLDKLSQVTPYSIDTLQRKIRSLAKEIGLELPRTREKGEE